MEKLIQMLTLLKWGLFEDGAAILGLLTGRTGLEMWPWRGFFLQLQGLVLSKNSGCKRSKKMSYFLHGMHLSSSEVCIPQMLLWWRAATFMRGLPNPHPRTVGPATWGYWHLERGPCLPQCSVPQHQLVLQREVSKSLSSCTLGCNHSCVKNTKQKAQFLSWKGQTLWKWLQVRWLVRACVIFF